MLLPMLTHVFDVVGPELSEFMGLEVGAPISHAFPRDSVVDVGARLGESAWTAFSDTTGLFFDQWARPLR